MYIGKTRFWQTSKNAKINPKCQAIIFKNTGDTTVKINGAWELAPGEETPAISQGHPEAVDLTEYEISFAVPAGAAPQITALIIDQSKSNTRNGDSNKCEKY